VSVEFCEDVFDVVFNCSRANVELIGNRSCAVAFCQPIQNLNFTRREAHVTWFGIRGNYWLPVLPVPALRPYKFIQCLFQPLAQLNWTDDVDSMTRP